MSRILVRLFTWIFLLVSVFIASRGLIRALPGDPIETLLAESGTSIPVETLRHDLGLDLPFWQSLAQDFSHWIHGDLGTSLIHKKPIAPILIQRFTQTLKLTLLAALLTLLMSIGLGLPAAAKRGGFFDRICSLYGGLGAALPLSWFGPFLLLLFGVWIPLFPVGGHCALPAFALAFSLSGFWSRLIRERVRESLSYGSARGARARGISEWKILLKYGFAPIAGPLVAYFGTQIGGLLTGTFIVEMIFDWRGLGSLLIDAVLKRDYPVIEATLFLTAALSLLGIFLGDELYLWIDRRLPESEHS